MENHFNFYSKNTNESNLYNSMQQELISQFGIDCKYCIRDNYNPDTLLGEDPSSVFTEENSFDIRMYSENINEFGGEDEIFSKFGIQVANELVLFVQQDKIHQYIGNIPFAGDLVYIPVMERLFQITKAEEKHTFFLFGKLMTYKLSMKIMDYSQEQLQTNIDEIDELVGKTSVIEDLLDNGQDNVMYIISTITPEIGQTLSNGVVTATITDYYDNKIISSTLVTGSTVTIAGLYIGTVSDRFVTRGDIIDILNFDEENGLE